MKTSLNNIIDLIKSVVAYYVKEWCADIHYNGQLKKLPMHPLTVAKHIATYLGYDNKDVYVTAHMRTYANIKELNEKEARRIPFIIEDFESNNTDTEFGYRYVIADGKKTADRVPHYYTSGAADDTVVLFLVENDIPESTSTDMRLFEDEFIKTGRIIAAVEVRCSIPYKTYVDYPDLTTELFRTTFKEKQDAGYGESKIYHDTVTDDCVIWNIECIHSVVQLYQQYALQNLDDTKFMHEITSTLPETHIFKSTKDYEIYSNNKERISGIENKFQALII